MRVIVQRLADSSSSGAFFGFVNQVYEVSLRTLTPSSPWQVLEKIEAAAPLNAGERLPILHKGFFDSHLHVTWMGLRQNEVDLQHCRSPELLMQMAADACLNSRAEIVRGHGWNEADWNLTLEAIPSLFEDKLPEGRPLIFWRNCGHSALVNRAMRARARRKDLSVFITDRELHELMETLPQPDAIECAQAFARAQERLIANGISAVGDMSLDETTLTGIKLLAERGELMVDVAGMFDAGKAPSVEGEGPIQISNAGSIGPLDRPAEFTVRHWKRYLDGSLGSRTAWLSQPYADSEGFGDSLQTTRTLVEEAREALMAGFHLSFHAIGDAALDQALEVGDVLRRQMQSRRQSDMALDQPGTFHRIEHGQVIRDDQLLRMKSQGFWAVCAQPGHRVADASFVSRRLGEDRLKNQAYRARAICEAGIAFAIGTDAPIDVIEPALVIRAAMTHPNPHERLSFDEAVWFYTTGSRLQLGLKPGALGIGSTVLVTEAF